MLKRLRNWLCPEPPPWEKPTFVFEQYEPERYKALMARLAELRRFSRASRCAIHQDQETGQYWFSVVSDVNH